MASFQKTSAGIGIADTVSSGEFDTDEGVYRAQYDSTRELENSLASITSGRRITFQYNDLYKTVDSEEFSRISEYNGG